MEIARDAQELYLRGRFQEALQAAQAACDRRPSDAAAWSLLARVARHAGMPGASDLAFVRASTLDPSRPLPVRVSRERFTQLVLETAPEHAHVHVEELPPPEAVEHGVDPDSLSRSDPGAATILYQVNFENSCSTEDEIKRLLASTLQP